MILVVYDLACSLLLLGSCFVSSHPTTSASSSANPTMNATDPPSPVQSQPVNTTDSTAAAASSSMTSNEAYPGAFPIRRKQNPAPTPAPDQVHRSGALVLPVSSSSSTAESQAKAAAAVGRPNLDDRKNTFKSTTNSTEARENRKHVLQSRSQQKKEAKLELKRRMMAQQNDTASPVAAQVQAQDVGDKAMFDALDDVEADMLQMVQEGMQHIHGVHGPNDDSDEEL